MALPPFQFTSGEVKYNPKLSERFLALSAKMNLAKYPYARPRLSDGACLGVTRFPEIFYLFPK